MKQILILVTLIFLSFNASAEETDIRFATDWKAQAEHGGFYQAIAKGYYKKRGLNVTIRPGGPQVDVPRLIAAGAIDIGMASNSFQPINLLAVGADVKIVMAAFQKDPQVLMVHPRINASSMADLKGMPIFISDSAVATFWPWLKARFDFKDSQIRKYTYSLAPWLVNKNTAQEGYLSSEPHTASTAGVIPKVFLFADEGYAGYGGMVMVRGDYLANNRDVVRAFVEASVEGWRDYVWGDPSAGNALILKDNPDMNDALIAYAIEAMRRNEILGPKSHVGRMSARRWHNFYDEMVTLDVLTPGLDVSQVYTNEFLAAGSPK